jgi:uncharacterized Zn-finger protein
MSHTPVETITVTEHSVACNGGGGALGHPKVYLHLDASTHQVTCPYCSRLFIAAGTQHHPHAA